MALKVELVYPKEFLILTLTQHPSILTSTPKVSLIYRSELFLWHLKMGERHFPQKIGIRLGLGLGLMV